MIKVVIALLVGMCGLYTTYATTTTYLKHWDMQTSKIVGTDGKSISGASYTPHGWHSVNVPSTVMAGLVEDGTHPDPFYGYNLKHIDRTQFNTPWWYRTTADITLDTTDTVTLVFEGINYRAQVWCNGKEIGTEQEVVGAFTYFHFDITTLATEAKGKLVLALLLIKPHDAGWPPLGNSTDLAISMYDWCPIPPDQNMGIWRDVYVSVTGPVVAEYPMVDTVFPDPANLKEAEVTVMVELRNWKNMEIHGNVHLTLSPLQEQGTAELELSKKFTVKSGETLEAFFRPSEFPQLKVSNPVIWWPRQMGKPNLHKLTACFTVDGQTTPSSCIKDVSFGLRQMTAALTPEKYQLFYVNHQPFVITGAGWAPDMFQRHSRLMYTKHIEYALDMNLNVIRMEGKMEADDMFEVASELGMLLMPGWGCCDAWMHWPYWKAEQYRIAYASLHSQIKRLRIYPAILMWFIGSDQPPPKHILEEYVKILHVEHWPNPYMACADNCTTVLGPNGMKQSGPYAWVSPNFWLEAAKVRPITDANPFIEHAGAFSDMIEGGPGASPMSAESWKLTVPNEQVWPVGEPWSWHTGNPVGDFATIKYFHAPLDARYGVSDNVDEFLYKSQAQSYESHKAMFEGFNVNRFSSTGVIQWMLNNAWPDHMWHLYDYYYNPGGAYFGTKKALYDIQAVYNYQNHSIAVINNLYTTEWDLREVSAQIFDMQTGKLVWEKKDTTKYTLQKYAVKWMNKFIMPTNHSNIKGLTTDCYYVRLNTKAERTDTHDMHTTYNEYWMSTKKDVLDWKNLTWFTVYDKSYTNYHPLQQLPPVGLNVTVQEIPNTKQVVQCSLEGKSQKSLAVTIGNPYKDRVAFLVSIVLHDSTKRKLNDMAREEEGSTVPHPDTRILPLFLSDNWFTLLPLETKRVDAAYCTPSNAGSDEFYFNVETFNDVVD